jgi:chromosomal replication initiator protein
VLNSVFSIPWQPIDALADADHRPLRGFVAGVENVALLVAADSITTRHQYNPLFLYGPTGVGKTHLLHTLLGLFAERTNDRSQLFYTASDYCRTLLRAHELDAIGELRQKHRDVGFLALDDLQNIAANEHAQQELLFTLDQRLAQNQMTVLTCRSGPAELHPLLPGLQSRLSAGLSLPVVAPGPAAREAILRELLEFHGLEVTPEAQALLVEPGARATRKLNTVAQLNSALIELSHSVEQPISAASVRDLLHHPPPGVDLSIRDIVRHSARHFQFLVSDLVGSSRRRSNVRARGIAIYISRQLLGSSFESLGEHFGRRDHTTIMHSFHKIEGLIQTDPTIQEAVDEITGRLGVR